MRTKQENALLGEIFLMEMWSQIWDSKFDAFHVSLLMSIIFVKLNFFFFFFNSIQHN